MKQRSNLIILFGIAFFLIGGVIVFLVLDGELPGEDACWERGGVPALAPDQKNIVCLDPEALR